MTTPPAKPATAKSAASPEQVRLKQRIETVCGKAARDVEVLPSAGKDLTVRLKTRTTADGQRVSNLVLRLPELTTYRVTLDVQVVP